MRSRSSPARSTSGASTSSAAPSRWHCSRPSPSTPGAGRGNLPRRSRPAARDREPTSQPWRAVVASVLVVEDLAESAREGFWLAGVSELAAEEAAVVAREHGRLLTEQLGGGHRRAPGEGAQGLLAHG